MVITVVNPDTTVTPVPQVLVIVQPPAVSSLNPASVNAGSPAFALTLTGTRFQNGMTVYFNSAPVPSTLVNNQKFDTLIANIPATAVVTAGTVPVTAGTLDGFLTPAVPFVINTTGPPPLQLLTLSLPSGAVGAAYSTTLQASQGAGGYVFSLTGGTLPAGLQFSAAGVISGTPTTYGASQFTVQVADSAQATVSRTFTLNIAPAPLQITTGPLANTQVNTPISVQFAGTGGIPPYTFVQFGALPAGVSFSNTGLLSGTPTKTGSFPFTVFINDTTSASARQNYTLNVALPGLLITPPSPLPAGQINVPYTTQLAATGGLGSPYFWSATGLPNGLTIANNSGLIAGIPRAAGTFSIAVTVSDTSNATDTQTYALTIAASALSINSPPLPNGAVGSPYNAAVSATGGSGNYTFTATGLPAGVTLSTSGIVSGTPTTAGTFSVVVTATDAAASAAITASATFKVTIAPQLAVTATTIPNGVVGTALPAVQLTATGGTSPYQFQSANLPPGLTLASNGTLSGTPTAAGTFSFTVFVVDNNGALASGTEKMTVGLPAAPSVTISGLPPSTAPATQQFAQVSLSEPLPGDRDRQSDHDVRAHLGRRRSRRAIRNRRPHRADHRPGRLYDRAVGGGSADRHGGGDHHRDGAIAGRLRGCDADSRAVANHQGDRRRSRDHRRDGDAHQQRIYRDGDGLRQQPRRRWCDLHLHAHGRLDAADVDGDHHRHRALLDVVWEFGLGALRQSVPVVAAIHGGGQLVIDSLGDRHADQRIGNVTGGHRESAVAKLVGRRPSLSRLRV